MLWIMLRQGIQPILKQRFTPLYPHLNQFRQFSARFSSSHSPLKTRFINIVTCRLRQSSTSTRFFSSRRKVPSQFQRYIIPSLRSLKSLCYSFSNPMHVILAINTGVFIAWQYASLRRINGDSTFSKFMYENFTLNMQAPRLWTFVTCIFSHKYDAHCLD
jgi:hypothetical protein